MCWSRPDELCLQMKLGDLFWLELSLYIKTLCGMTGPIGLTLVNVAFPGVS